MHPLSALNVNGQIMHLKKTLTEPNNIPTLSNTWHGMKWTNIYIYIYIHIYICIYIYILGWVKTSVFTRVIKFLTQSQSPKRRHGMPVVKPCTWRQPQPHPAQGVDQALLESQLGQMTWRFPAPECVKNNPCQSDTRILVDLWAMI